MSAASDPVALLARLRGEPEPPIELVALSSRKDRPAPWPVMDEAAFLGLAGEVVRLIDPTTEADPVAVLANFLLSFGSAVGRGPHLKVGHTRHGVNEFALLVGDTAKARKGSSRDGVRAVMSQADPTWSDRLVSGLSSGEGLIWAVRDPVMKEEQLREKGRLTGETVTVTVDPGVTDKRLFVEEEEFSNVLKQTERQGNTLSEVTRAAWDARERLQVLTKQNAAVATDAHISIIGHITAAEYQRRLTETEQANGLANRFLLFCVTRSKVQAFLPEIESGDLNRVSGAVGRALQAARTRGQVVFSAAARAFWEQIYPVVSAPSPGILGAMTARAETHALRLALMYALIEQADCIEVEHLVASCAVVDYVRGSVAHVFGDASGDPVADRIVAMLREQGDLDRTGMQAGFSRHQLAGGLDKALDQLIADGKVLAIREETGGRPRTRYRLGVA